MQKYISKYCCYDRPKNLGDSVSGRDKSESKEFKWIIIIFEHLMKRREYHDDQYF